MKQGWVKLHRKLLENPVFAHDKTAKLLFVDLLLLVDSKTGSYDAGRYQLAEITGIKPTTLYKALIRLESTGMVTLASNNRYTTITICKWRSYQQYGDSTDNNKVTSKGHQSNIKVTLNKNKRIEKNTTNVVLASKPKTPSTDINEVFEFWEQCIGYKIESRVKQNRYAASNLIKKHGKDKVFRIIGGVAQAKQDRYAPRIADFCELQFKFNELISWGQTKSKQSNVEVI